MKKLLTAATIVMVCMAACNNNSTKEATTTDSTGTKQVENRANEISDSTKMLDKKLADPNSPYTPDSLK